MEISWKSWQGKRLGSQWLSVHRLIYDFAFLYIYWAGRDIHMYATYHWFIEKVWIVFFFTTVAPQMKHIPTSSFHLGDSMPKTDPSRRPPSMPNDKSSSPSRLNPLSALDFYSHHFSLDDLFCKQSSWKETVYKKYCINYSTLCFFDCIKKTAIRLKLYF